MILYFSGTGNSLAVARQLAERLNEPLLSLYDAQDLTHEKRVGLVFPTYDFNLPPAVRMLVSKLTINPEAYVFAVITCGGQAGNSSIVSPSLCISISQMPAVPPKLPSIWKGGWASSRLA